MRLVMIATSALLLLLGTGQAATTRFAADVPLLDLSPVSTAPGHTGTTEADLYMPASKEMAKVVLFFPPGYGGVLGRAIASKVGDVLVWDPSYLPSFGSITVQDPATLTTNTCAPGLHQAAWVLTLENSDDLPPTPILIDATTGSDAALGAYRAQFCLPKSTGTYIKIHELDLEFSKLTNPAAAGAYKWRAFITPYVNGAANDGATFELRGTIPMPTTIALRGRYDRGHRRAILTGRMTASGYDVTGTYLDVYANSRYIGSIRANAKGSFSLKRRIKKTTRFRLWTATYNDCVPASTAPGGCPSDSLANIASKVVKVVVKKR